MKTNGQRRPEEIQAEIDRTRHDLNETLHALEQRLTPGQLVDQGLHYLRGSGANEYVTSLRNAATRDPVPLALVGVGLAWLALSGRRQSQPYAVSDDASASSATSTMKDKMSQTTQRVSQTAQAARERASRMGESARHQAERLRSGYSHLMQEQPLALGAIGLAVGAVLAAATPRTRAEEQFASETRQPETRTQQALGQEPDEATAVGGATPLSAQQFDEGSARDQPQQPEGQPDLGKTPL